MSKIYFGTRDYMQWVKAPLVNTPLSNVGWSNSGTDLNGGGFALNSPTAHKEYELSWGASPAQDIYEVLDYRTGAYGEGYLYYVDPFAMRTNVLPGSFSMPRQLCNAGLMGGSHANPTGSRVVATNLATNPSFETSSGSVEVYRNLATNPSFESTSGTVEVYRNLALDPLLTGPPSPNNAATTTILGGVAVPPGNPQGFTTGASSTQTPGSLAPAVLLSCYNLDKLSDHGPVRFIGFWVHLPEGYRARGYAQGGAAPVFQPVPSGWSWYVIEVERANQHVVFQADKTSGPVPEGDVAYITGVTALENVQPKESFTGSYSPDPDLTPSWTGAVNNSPSVLTGRLVSNVIGPTPDQGTSYQTADRPYAGNFAQRTVLRITGPISIPVANLNLPPTEHTLILMARASRPGITVIPRIRVTEGDPVLLTEDWQPISVTRVAGAGGIGQTGLVLRGATGHRVGDLIDTDAVFITEGEYTGPYFDGSTSPDPDLTASWTGTANESASVLTGRLLTAVPQATLADSVAYQSADEPAHGDYFQRVTAKSTSAFSIPVTTALPASGSPYTLLLRARASRSGTEVIPRIRGTLLAPVTLTNDWKVIRFTGVAGTGSNIQTGFQVNSGSAQSGDFFDIDSVVLAQGTYTGDYFDGSSIPSNGFTFVWSSTPNASTSSKTVAIDSPNYTGFVQPKPVVVSGADSRSTYVPVPPGYKLWLAYTATSSLLLADGSAVPPTTPTATSPNWFTSASPVELKWSGTGTVWGAWGLILKDGETPASDARWVPGKGASGMRFKGEPQVTGLSAVYGDEGGLLNASATLIETELWSN